MSNEPKLQTKDLIMIGVLNTVFVAVFFVFGMLMGVTPLTALFYSSAAAVPGGIVFMLLLAKVPKTGVFIISGVVQGGLMFLLQFYWPTIITVIAMALIAELIVISGKYTSFSRLIIGYVLLIIGYTLGSFGPVILFTKSYIKTATGLGYDPTYVNNLVSILSYRMGLLLVVLSIIGAILGGLIGKKLLYKHFTKAGIIYVDRSASI